MERFFFSYCQQHSWTDPSELKKKRKNDKKSDDESFRLEKEKLMEAYIKDEMDDTRFVTEAHLLFRQFKKRGIGGFHFEMYVDDAKMDKDPSYLKKKVRLVVQRLNLDFM